MSLEFAAGGEWVPAVLSFEAREVDEGFAGDAVVLDVDFLVLGDFYFDAPFGKKEMGDQVKVELGEFVAVLVGYFTGRHGKNFPFGEIRDGFGAVGIEFMEVLARLPGEGGAKAEHAELEAAFLIPFKDVVAAVVDELIGLGLEGSKLLKSEEGKADHVAPGFGKFLVEFEKLVVVGVEAVVLFRAVESLVGADGSGESCHVVAIEIEDGFEG